MLTLDMRRLQNRKKTTAQIRSGILLKNLPILIKNKTVFKRSMSMNCRITLFTNETARCKSAEAALRALYCVKKEKRTDNHIIVQTETVPDPTVLYAVMSAACFDSSDYSFEATVSDNC